MMMSFQGARECLTSVYAFGFQVTGQVSGQVTGQVSGQVSGQVTGQVSGDEPPLPSRRMSAAVHMSAALRMSVAVQRSRP